jgi:hypothetical protein
MAVRSGDGLYVNAVAGQQAEYTAVRLEFVWFVDDVLHGELHHQIPINLREIS